MLQTEFYVEEVVRLYYDGMTAAEAIEQVMDTKTAQENKNLQELFKRMYEAGGPEHDENVAETI